MKKVPVVLAQFAVIATLSATLLAGCSSMQPKKVQFDDTAITASVNSEMAVNGSVKSSQVGVTTNEGVVTLTGRVKTDEERKTAVRIARNTNGVKKVNDLIKVGEMPEVGGE